MRRLYLIVGGVLLALAVAGVVAFEHEQEDRAAAAQAAELTRRLEVAGLRAPADRRTLVRVLGSDGGALCDRGRAPLTRANLYAQLGNGAAGVGRRAFTVDRKTVQGEELVLAVYCPDELPGFRAIVSELDFDDVVRDR